MDEYLKTYESRVRKLRNEMYPPVSGIGEQLYYNDFKNALREALDRIYPEDGAAYTDHTLSMLTSAKRGTFPLTKYIPAHTEVLHTSIAYLIGQHDIREKCNERALPNPKFQECWDEYRRINPGHTLRSDAIIHPQWELEHKDPKKVKRSDRIGPYIRISDALDWDIDYVLGLSDIRSWKYYCLANSMFNRLPNQILIFLEPVGYGMLSEDRSSVVFQNGEKIFPGDPRCVEMKIVRHSMFL